MGRDRDLQKLVTKAEKQRMLDAKEALDNEREERVETREAAKRPVPLKKTRQRGAFLRVTRSNIGFLWWVGLATTLISVKFAMQIWWLFAAFGVAFAVRVFFFFRKLQREYPAYVRFPEDLSFTISGGAKLVDNEKLIDNYTNWSGMATLNVVLGEGADAAVIDAALDVFVTDANGCFYWAGKQIAGASTDPRKKWKRSGHEISGSMNLPIIVKMYRLVHLLDQIQRRIGGIQSASFTLDENAIYGVYQA